MHAHFVLAHPEPESFNAHLVDAGVATLQAEGWTTSVSNLYGIGFDPCEGPTHFSDPISPGRFYTQAEQAHAGESGTLPDHVAAELACLDRADLLVVQYPLWWHLPPAILKGWFDRVFASGVVYSAGKRFETGRFVGKRAMLSVTVGTGRGAYAFDGHSGDIDLLLWPVELNFAYVGYTVLSPFVSYGVESRLQQADPAAIKARLGAILGDFTTALRRVASRPVVPFNGQSDWGADGHIAPDAPAYSPFARHKEHLDLG